MKKKGNHFHFDKNQRSPRDVLCLETPTHPVKNPCSLFPMTLHPAESRTRSDDLSTKRLQCSDQFVVYIFSISSSNVTALNLMEVNGSLGVSIVCMKENSHSET